MVRKQLTKGIFILCCAILTAINFSLTIDQKPDLLIIGQDTLFLRSFPLEDLGFEIRPFKSADIYVPNLDCLREYQATWKLINNKLYLAEIRKDNITKDKIDIVNYFKENKHSPIVVNGLIFADWVTIQLSTYPKNYGHWSCYAKRKGKKWKTCLTFEKGIATYSRFGKGD